MGISEAKEEEVNVSRISLSVPNVPSASSRTPSSRRRQLPTPFSNPRRTLKLEKETRSTLYSLCLTSHTFLHLAQPLLFNFIRFDRFETVAQVVENNQGNDLLSLIRSVKLGDLDIYDEARFEQFGQLYQLVETFWSRTKEIEEVSAYAYSDEWILTGLSGQNLRRLYLGNTDSDAASLPNAEFVSLEVLGLASGYTLRDLDPRYYPSLRHLFVDDQEGELEPEEEEVIRNFGSQLDSLGLLCDIYNLSPSSDTLVEASSLLVTLPWHWPEKLSPGGPSLVNLRINISSVLLSPPKTSSECSSSLALIGSHLGSSIQFSRLETVYLPPIESLPLSYRTDAIVNSIKQLVLICRSRNVEVIYEEQSDQMTGESQISEEFMRRMTRKRLEREAKLFKEE
ncbi:hypothetical protein JCM5350_000195 [Sporobolomyces pararoseus]